MKEERCRIVLVAMLTFVSGYLMAVAAAAEEHELTVQLKVNCTQKALQDEVRSYVQRELRSLKDVSILDANARHEVTITVLESRNERDVPIGYAVSVLVVSRFPSKQYFGLPIFQMTEKDRANVENGTKEYVLIEMNGLYSCDKDELRKVCERVVVNIDSEVIEPDRKIGRTLDGLIKQVQEFNKRSSSSEPRK